MQNLMTKQKLRYHGLVIQLLLLKKLTIGIQIRRISTNQESMHLNKSPRSNINPLQNLPKIGMDQTTLIKQPISIENQKILPHKILTRFSTKTNQSDLPKPWEVQRYKLHGALMIKSCQALRTLDRMQQITKDSKSSSSID